MAIWQYPFYVLPKAVGNLTDEQLATIYDEGQNVDGYWANTCILRFAFNEIAEILPVQKSWCKTIDQYGDLEDNCFEVAFEEENVTDVSFRINFTKNFDTVLVSIMAFCKKNDLVILGENYKRLPQDIGAIKTIIFSSSNAAVYSKLADPDVTN